MGRFKLVFLYALPALLIGGVLLIPLLFKKGENSSDSSSGLQEVGWKELRTLDFQTGHLPDEVKEKIKTRVKIPGFAVPLGHDFKSVQEFILVPSQGMCVHVPPPPPNMMVFVELKESISMELLQGPIWIEGMMRLETVKNEYGEAAWLFRAQEVKPYLN
jgi:hypothetical protein